MDLNHTNLRTAGVGFKAAYNIGFNSVAPLWQRIATEVPSSTSENEYGWLGAFPAMREWLGERVINQIGTHDYTLKNRKFESTVAVLLDKLADDNVGIYRPLMQGMGESAARHPDELVFEALLAGFSQSCYDGQNFFDAEHPVLDKDKKEQPVSNLFGGKENNPAWFLMDTSRALKPLIRQVRQKPEFATLSDISSDHVFNLDEVLYGVKSRENVGYGFWQMAFASKQEFTAEHFAKMYTAMTSQTGDYGRKLALRPNVLLVPSAHEDAAKVLMSADKINGEPNPHKGKVEVVVSPWLND
ncbi:Mu-like prophage major head subunit gpT family protein [Polycladidibacter stylochi]|uniref:Mu-like prophage major head subunit gpT family protein n=1 Tax=Polycladidibacter stylochi TaxID=1807766 RepID=UPI0008300A0F|nr:Mu-like prophage major head subunit gpT family protein [Pseudovibrio stylochi]